MKDGRRQFFDKGSDALRIRKGTRMWVCQKCRHRQAVPQCQLDRKTTTTCCKHCGGHLVPSKRAQAFLWKKGKGKWHVKSLPLNPHKKDLPSCPFCQQKILPGPRYHLGGLISCADCAGRGLEQAQWKRRQAQLKHQEEIEKRREQRKKETRRRKRDWPVPETLFELAEWLGVEKERQKWAERDAKEFARPFKRGRDNVPEPCYGCLFLSFEAKDEEGCVVRAWCQKKLHVGGPFKGGCPQFLSKEETKKFFDHFEGRRT